MKPNIKKLLMPTTRNKRDVWLINSQNIFVLPFGYCVCKLPSDFMGGLIIDLSRLKGLYQMVG